MYEHYHYTPMDYNTLNSIRGNDEGPDWRETFKSFLYVVAWIVFIGVIITMCSCTTIRYVPVVQVRTDTVQITKHQRDSIWLHDSIHVVEKQKGDTMYLEVEKWHNRYIEKETHDTTYIATHDTVPQPYPVPEYVEKRLSWWQQTRMHLGEALLAALLVAAGWWIFKKRVWWMSLLKKFL